MKPRAFDYVRAHSLDEVFQALDAHGDEAKILAGGQSLVPALNMRFAAPEVLVDVAGIAELSGIERLGDVLRIGAMTRYVDVAASDLVSRHAPLVAAAIPHIAHAAIRNRGTFGGSLCNADPASELPACALTLDARFNIRSSAGDRAVRAAEFFEGTYATCLEPNEVLVSVDLPVAPDDGLVFFDELARRRGDYAMAGLAGTARRRGDGLADVRLCFFGVSDTAWLAEPAMAALEGRAPDTGAADAACGALDGALTPFEDLTTSSGAKLHLMKVLTRRAVAAFAGKEA